MRKLFGCCLLSQAEVDDLVGTIEAIGRQLSDARQEREELRRILEMRTGNTARIAQLLDFLSNEVRRNGEQITTLQGRTRKHLLKLLHESGIPYDPDVEANAITASLREMIYELADEVEMLTGQLHGAAGKPGEERGRKLRDIAEKRQGEREDKE